MSIERRTKKGAMLKSKHVLFILIFYSFQAQGVTLVYRMPVRRVFNLPKSETKNGPRIFGTVLPITYFRNSTIHEDDICVLEDRRVNGSLINLRCDTMKWWGEVSTGIEKDSGKFNGDQNFCASRTGFDDIVITGGYRYFLSERTQLIPYILLGIPTRRKLDMIDRFDPFVGTRFFNAGLGGEASYSFINERKRTSSFVWQGRFLHGFKRAWFPILPLEATVFPGDVFDFLFALQHREGKSVIQGGYDLTVFSNEAVRFPDRKIEGSSFTRNSGYVNFAYGFKKGLLNKPTVLGFGGSISKTKRFDSTNYVAWAFLTQEF